MKKNSYIAKILLQENRWSYWMKALDTRDHDADARINTPPVGTIVNVGNPGNTNTRNLIAAGYLPCDGTSMQDIPDNYIRLKEFLSRIDGNNRLPNLTATFSRS